MTSTKPASLHRKGTKTVLRPQVITQGSNLLDIYDSEQAYLQAVGEHIRQRRIAIGLGDQHDLAEALGSTQSYVSRIESGNGLALLITLINLSNALDCSLDHLALRTDVPRPHYPDEIDDLTIMYRPENAHQRAILVRLLDVVHAMSPDQQLLLLRTAESMSDAGDPGSVQTVISPSGKEQPATIAAGAEVEAEAASAP